MISIIDKFNDATTSILVGAVSATTGGVLWMIRRLLTNQKQIALLEAAIHSRDDQRKEDREVLVDIQRDIKDVRKELVTARVKLATISHEIGDN